MFDSIPFFIKYLSYSENDVQISGIGPNGDSVQSSVSLVIENE